MAGEAIKLTKRRLIVQEQKKKKKKKKKKLLSQILISSMAAGGRVTKEVLPPVLPSNSDPPPLFDGTTRLYTAYTCPFAQRVWIARNYKGLQDKIQLVPISMEDIPSWYKEKVYPPAKVPVLEHNNEIKGESLDLLKYLDSTFEGPKIFPDDPAMKEYAEELLDCAFPYAVAVMSYLKGGSESEMNDALNKLEEALSKFDDGPFFLGQFSVVDIAYAPFMERNQPLLLELKKYDITSGRPNLGAWIQEMDKVDAYKQTKLDLQLLLPIIKRRILGITH